MKRNFYYVIFLQQRLARNETLEDDSSCYVPLLYEKTKAIMAKKKNEKLACCSLINIISFSLPL